MKSEATPWPDHAGEIKQAQAHARVVQQLMFNRILTFVRLLSIDGVTVVGFDANVGTLVCNLTGVNFVVEVNLGDVEQAIGETVVPSLLRRRSRETLA